MTRNIEKEIVMSASPERVFQALTEKADLERWFVQKAEIDLRPGGAIRLEWSPEAVESGTILAVEPHHRLSYNWVALEPTPTTLIFELIPENGGTRLQLHHTEIGEGEVWDNYYTALDSGWNTHFKNLTALLETGNSEAPKPTGNIHNERV